MASAFLILDAKGSPLIYRAYRGDVSVPHVISIFQDHVLDEEETNIAPVFEVEGFTYAFVRVNDVYFMMVSSINSCSLLQIAFMRRCVSIFESYFNKVTEESIRDNFVIIYELMDEICDFGYPQYTEERVLKEYITQEGFTTYFSPDTVHSKTKALPAAVTGVGGATPWRVPGKYKYTKNEVFLDVIESISLLVNQDGDTISSEISGKIRLKVKLSGMPLLKVGLNDKILFDLTGRIDRAVDMEDVKFHQCVRLNQFESDRIISFIPPDGVFDLLTYRLNKTIQPLVVVNCRVVRHGTSRVEMFCSARTTYRKSNTANFIDVIIPIPSDADKPEAHCSHGHVTYAPDSSVLLWGLRNVSGGKEWTCRVQFHLPSVRSSDVLALSKVPIEVKFSIPYFSASGIQVRYVKITDRSNYTAMPWVRYVTQSGEYQIRTN